MKENGLETPSAALDAGPRADGRSGEPPWRRWGGVQLPIATELVREAANERPVGPAVPRQILEVEGFLATEYWRVDWVVFVNDVRVFQGVALPTAVRPTLQYRIGPLLTAVSTLAEEDSNALPAHGGGAICFHPTLPPLEYCMFAGGAQRLPQEPCNPPLIAAEALRWNVLSSPLVEKK